MQHAEFYLYYQLANTFQEQDISLESYGFYEHHHFLSGLTWLGLNKFEVFALV